MEFGLDRIGCEEIESGRDCAVLSCHPEPPEPRVLAAEDGRRIPFRQRAPRAPQGILRRPTPQEDAASATQDDRVWCSTLWSAVTRATALTVLVRPETRAGPAFARATRRDCALHGLLHEQKQSER